MILSPADVRSCLDRAREIYEEYKRYEIGGDAPWRSTDGLLKLVTEYLGKKVTVRYLNVNKNLITATYVLSKDPSGQETYEIYLLSGLTPLEERFALCKELFHVLLDDEACRSTAIFSHLEEVAATFPVYDSTPNRAAAWEILAQAAAMEFMFSFREREDFLANGNGNPDFTAASSRWGIPQGIIEEYCSPGHMKFFHAYR